MSHKHTSAKILRIGLGIMLAATLALLVVTLSGAPVMLIPVAIFIAVASVGLVLGNATALALGAVPKATGTASAVLGSTQFALAAVVSPLVGIAGEHTARPLAVCMFAATAVAFIGFFMAHGIRTKML